MRRKRTSIALLTTVGAVILACGGDNPVKPEDPSPAIREVRTPERMWTETDMTLLVSVDVTDPQGLTDIDSVVLTIVRPDSLTIALSTTLNDSAQRGDLIACDGVYTRQIETSFLHGETGDYSFVFQATDCEGNRSAAVAKTVPALSGTENEPPYISEIVLPEIISVDVSVEYSFNVHAADPQGVSDLAFLVFRIHRQENPTVAHRDTVYDNGTAPDAAPGDGIYTGTFTSSFADSIVGVYPFSFQAFDRARDSTDLVRRDVKVGNEANAPPNIFNLSAPDTLSRWAGTTLLSVEAMDPQGMSDVRRVFFNVTKPDSTPAQGNPFEMRDDGQGGDIVANDGMYSLRIEITPENEPGEYTFVFEAEDLSGARSNVIVHTMTVI